MSWPTGDEPAGFGSGKTGIGVVAEEAASFNSSTGFCAHRGRQVGPARIDPIEGPVKSFISSNPLTVRSC